MIGHPLNFFSLKISSYGVVVDIKQVPERTKTARETGVSENRCDSGVSRPPRGVAKKINITQR